MAWRLTDDKPLSESMMAYLTDAYMRHSVSVGWTHPTYELSPEMQIPWKIRLFRLYVLVLSSLHFCTLQREYNSRGMCKILKWSLH